MIEYMNYFVRVGYSLFYLVAIIVAGNLFLNSCRSISPVATTKVRITGDDIYRMTSRNHSDINTYSASRMIINIIDDDQEINLRGSVRIKWDSAILVSVNAFAGIEAARFLFTADSVKMIDRINRSYFAGNYDESRRFIPYALNYDILQSVFFASPFSFTDEMNGLEGSNENYEFNDQHLKLRFSINGSAMATGQENKDNLQIILDRDFLTRSVDFHSERNNVFASLKYNSFSEIPGYNLPDDISLTFVSHNLPLIAGLRLSGIEINKPVRFPFNIPSGYSRLNN
ncbi:MAG: DUF4292 domain-containing protein [Ignavibacteriaceae bacterium]